ncbi:MAG: cytochrome c oxidase subunit 3 [Pyrinomonadaceae bacterium]|nr:cytochrome c oxidase subunit 3 [Pyrinomonadaceae bacterium]
MKVGLIEKIEDEEKRIAGRRSRRSGLGGGSNNQNGGDENGGGGNNPGNNIPEGDLEDEIYPSNKFRIGMWFVLLVVLMTFGGLIGAYIVISTKGVYEWKPFRFPVQVFVSTALLFSSSLTFIFARRSIIAEQQERARKWLLATTALGGVFIASQLVLWLTLFMQGVYMASNPYAGFFYILTAIHAIHVLGGITALGYLVLRTWLPTNDEVELQNRKMFANVIGWYWHFMDGLWIVLVVLLGFWK